MEMLLSLSCSHFVGIVFMNNIMLLQKKETQAAATIFYIISDCSSATASFQDFPPLGFFRRLVVMLTWLVISVVPSFFSWYLQFSLLYLTSLSLSFLYLHFVKVNLIWSNFKIHQWTGQINRIGSSWLWSCHGIDFWCRHPSNMRTVEETL